jgi:hypothetical protein
MGEDGGEFTTTPLGRAGALLEGVLLNEALEVLFQRTRDGARSPGTRTIP